MKIKNNKYNIIPLILMMFNLALMSMTLLFSGNVYASNQMLDSIHSKAMINNDGSVDLEQTWLYDDTNTEGTEHYINLNVGYSNFHDNRESVYISDYSVDLDGKPMEFQSNWDIKANFDSKSGYYGLIPISDNETELTFGITKHDINQFTIKYTIHNALMETTDNHKYFHWSFTPTDLNPSPTNMTAEITLENPETNFGKIYGFNYHGDVVFNDEDKKTIVTAQMDTNSYTPATTLNVFTSIDDSSANNKILNTIQSNQSIEDKVTSMLDGSDYDTPLDGSDYDTPNEDSGGKTTIVAIIVGFIVTVLPILLFLVMFLLVIFVIFKASQPEREKQQLISSIDRELLNRIQKDKEFYSREKPIAFLDFIPILETVLSIPEFEANLLEYYISKWTSDGVFEYAGEIEHVNRFSLSGRTTKEIRFILHPDKLTTESQLEMNIYSLFSDIADNENVLNTARLDQLNISKYQQLIKVHNNDYMNSLSEKGYVIEQDTGKTLTNESVEILLQHAGLQNYLRDYTLIHERGTKEIQLWDYLFHYAALYGIADEFGKELEKIPQMDRRNKEIYSRYYGHTGTARMNQRINRAVHANYRRHIKEQKERQRARSAGSGGRSSFGGGGGSSGGGRGGGTR